MASTKISPAKVKQNIEEMQKHSGIALWKSLGFYDINISRSLTTMIKHDEAWNEKFNNVGMWGAETADTLTWAWIWSACKQEIHKKQKIRHESEEFFEAVTELFEDVVYKTQVVDSVLTKSEYLRDKGPFSKMFGSFMSEATASASIMIDAYDKYHLDRRQGLTPQEAWKKHGKKIGRTIYVFALSAIFNSMMQAFSDAFRDDDEYETWGEKWIEAFIGNLIDELSPLTKLPIVSAIWDLMKELIKRPIKEWLDYDLYGSINQTALGQISEWLISATEILGDKVFREDTNYTWYAVGYKLLQAASAFTGTAVASLVREAATAWNNTIGVMAPSLKAKTYRLSEVSEIRYAFEDGYLTIEEAAKYLFDAGGASTVKTEIGTWYRGGKIAKTQAVTLLRKYADMDDAEITKTVNKWSCVVVTGIPYDEIDDRYLSGEISRSRAIEMYMRYGTMTREEAAKKVSRLK